MNNAFILTNTEIEEILANEYCSEKPVIEGTPWFMDSIYDHVEEDFTPDFLDSIQGLEEDMDSIECIIDFPAPVYEEELFCA